MNNKYLASSERDVCESGVGHIDIDSPELKEASNELEFQEESNMQLNNDDIVVNSHNSAKLDEQKEVTTIKTHLDNIASFSKQTTEKHNNLKICLQMNL